MAISASPKGIVAVVGVGPKLGRSIARKFAHEGYTVAILARRLSRIADEIAHEEKAQVFAIRIDCSDARSVREAFEGVHSLGFVEVLVYNAGGGQPVSWQPPLNFTHIRLDSFQTSLAVSAVGSFHCAQQVIPGMVERGKGTILFTGSSASVEGISGYCELSCGKFALRALSQCLAKEFQPMGIHVAHVMIDGVIGLPRSSSGVQRSGSGESSSDMSLDPDAIAQTYWHIHTQDRSAWTREVDLRSSNSYQRFY
ncbi:hypothetical protein ACLOJK_013606 [Asimina triloba]